MQQSIISQFNEEDYNKYSIIKPPSDWHGDHEKYTRVIVDSRVRNDNFPNPNNYEIPFDDDINDVISAQLIYMDLPFSSYLINQYYNKLVFTVSAVDYTITIPTGDYDYSSLKAKINEQLIAAGLSAITIDVNPLLSSYFFSSSAPFTLKFQNQTNTIALLLGFKNGTNYVSTGTGPYTIVAPYKYNFNFNNYIIMDIEQFDLLKSSDSILNKSFAVIPKNYDILGLSDNPKYIKRFSPPIAKLNKLRIRFYDRFGNDYDFQNMDHRFEILITSHKQRRRYGNIFAN